MKRYEILLIDLDDTILDFSAAEAVAYGGALAEFGIEKTQALLDRYHAVNLLWWEKLERGEADRDTILVERHRQLFRELGLEAKPEAFEAAYRRRLGVGHWFMPGAEEALVRLHSRGFRLFLASNGVSDTQHGRIDSAGIGPLFEDLFISEELGANKPDPAFFELCFARIPGFDREKTLMIGDSLTSDIRGGINAGVDTLWVNPEGRTAPPDCRPTWEIASLDQLPEIL